jgi:hypothetical protein
MTTVSDEYFKFSNARLRLAGAASSYGKSVRGTGLNSRHLNGAASVPRERHLLLSIHDVSPHYESAIDRLRDHLGRHAPQDRIALLVVPNYWGEAPIVAGSPFAGRLRDWADRGAEIFLHGWHHRDGGSHDTRAARFKARHMTAGEGEFLGIGRAAAASLMREGKALLSDIIGRDVAGFIAPAWLYGPGALQRSCRLRFRTG